jgi:hypothetical protein
MDAVRSVTPDSMPVRMLSPAMPLAEDLVLLGRLRVTTVNMMLWEHLDARHDN